MLDCLSNGRFVLRRRARLRLGGVRRARGAARGARWRASGRRSTCCSGAWTQESFSLRGPLLPGARDERHAEADPEPPLPVWYGLSGPTLAARAPPAGRRAHALAAPRHRRDPRAPSTTWQRGRRGGRRAARHARGLRRRDDGAGRGARRRRRSPTSSASSTARSPPRASASCATTAAAWSTRRSRSTSTTSRRRYVIGDPDFAIAEIAKLRDELGADRRDLLDAPARASRATRRCAPSSCSPARSCRRSEPALDACSARSSSPTAARSPSASSAPARAGHRVGRGLLRRRRGRARTCASPTRRSASARPPARESYLDVDAIIAAAERRRGADAIHPGYGFLSENADFAAPAQTHGLIFIGPPPEAIERMGDKTAARGAMAAAGVPVVPGHRRSPSTRPRTRSRSPREIGYPVMLKAAAGGGGKGMRVVARARTSSAAAFEARRARGARRLRRRRRLPRAATSSGRATSRSRSSADAHGNVVHLGERDCSIQRRHQKLIEESPSPARRRRAARARWARRPSRPRAPSATSAPARSSSCSTRAADFYFLEMNTRLQVEHPVTEMVTGLDLVQRADPRSPPGEPLSFAPGRRRARAATRSSAASTPRTRTTTSCPLAGHDHARTEPPGGPGVRVDTRRRTPATESRRSTTR